LEAAFWDSKRGNMTWSITNWVIEIIGGIIGANAAAFAVKEHSFGVLGQTVAGAVGGGLSGYFLQILAVTMVTGADTLNEPRFAEQIILQGLTGAVAGGVAMLLFGIVKQTVGQRRSTNK
jgi:hypothetical protein